VAVRQAGVTIRELHDRLVPLLAAVLPVLLVAALSAAVVLPRHDEQPFTGAVDYPALPADLPALAAPSVPVDTAPAPEPVAQSTVEPSAPVEVVAAPPPVEDLVEPVAEPAPDPATGPAVDPAPVPEDNAVAPARPAAEEPSFQEAPGPPPGSDAAAPSAPPAPPAPAPGTSSGEEGQTAAAAGSGPSDSERIFAEEFPAHAAARQSDDPATHSWAVLVGVNRYQGRTADTLGSVADVMVLREVLLSHGWRDDHILVLTDVTATHDRIVRGIEWLIRSTDDRSTVVFSFSGHMRHRDGVTALWPTDNRYIWAGDLGRMLGAIPAGRLWASLQGCHAEGLRAPGLEGPNRVVTYSSLRAEKSYEDPEVGHSVQGFYLFAEGFRDRHGDLDGDGRISVQEAHGWAAPRAHTRTSQRQTPVLYDGMAGAPFFLEIGST
jgi:hypothetical protein